MSARIVSPQEAEYVLMLIIGTYGETDYVQQFLSEEPEDVYAFVPDGWELLEDESEVRIRGYHDCDCCGRTIIDARYCDGCPRDAWEACNPAESNHCFTDHCDGTGCTFEGECEPNHEVRVWRENGDLMGLWEVEAQANGRVLVTQREGYERNAESHFASLWSAWQYAQGCAGMYAQTLREECECGEDDCGVNHEHGIFVQEVTESRDLSRA
ncbi:hypothetical protein Q3V23_23355 [Streptomyces sp. VNUA116]|uniref:hypothetical protein n=1 Tax=Streptomyces sp. VNUA116 TaxID=3062449 RepID=UPI002674626C|nr:hypothetical protein [Streptomyces sp. VNUA116]WKU46762.1 hypothetical protein Q3V23_23355 [Streptomyces sp. VNUA116]